MALPTMPTALTEYLLRLDRSLWGLPGAQRDEVLRGVGEYLAEDLARVGLEGALGLRWLVQEHGEPEAMGRAFRRAAWRDQGLALSERFVPVLAALGWMLFMGLLRGVDRNTPGYFGFLADFPALVLVLSAVRGGWRGLGPVPRVALCLLTGLGTGLLFCSQVCEGHGLALLEHGLYGALLAGVLERSALRPSLAWGLLDVAIFLGLMQGVYMLLAGSPSLMPFGNFAYHLLNGLGMQLVIWTSARAFRAIQRSDRMLAPNIS